MWLLLLLLLLRTRDLRVTTLDEYHLPDQAWWARDAGEMSLMRRRGPLFTVNYSEGRPGALNRILNYIRSTGETGSHTGTP